MKKQILISLLISFTIATAQTTTDQQVPILKTGQETSSIVNSIFSDIQKEKGIDNIAINSRMVAEVSVDQVIFNGTVVATILSEKGLRAKKELSTFPEFVKLFKDMKEVGSFQYPKIINIFVLEDVNGDKVILAIREGTNIPSLVISLL